MRDILMVDSAAQLVDDNYRNTLIGWMWNAVEQGGLSQFEVITVASGLGYRAPNEQLHCCEVTAENRAQYFTSMDNLALLVLVAEGEEL